MSASDPSTDGAAHAHYDRIDSREANDWWRQTQPAGAVLNRLMILFILAPVVLAMNSSYILSFLIFALMVPYGLLVRRLAVQALRRHLRDHPEARAQFEEAGVISR
jgi:hypothetical protein